MLSVKSASLISHTPVSFSSRKYILKSPLEWDDSAAGTQTKAHPSGKTRKPAQGGKNKHYGYNLNFRPRVVENKALYKFSSSIDEGTTYLALIYLDADSISGNKLLEFIFSLSNSSNIFDLLAPGMRI